MTAHLPDENRESPEEALESADQALVHAEEVRDRGMTLAEGWRKSRRDNNFRHMLRDLVPGAE